MLQELLDGGRWSHYLLQMEGVFLELFQPAWLVYAYRRMNLNK